MLRNSLSKCRVRLRFFWEECYSGSQTFLKTIKGGDMKRADLRGVTTLSEFYTEIRSFLESEYGVTYCAYHDVIREYMKDCLSYRELGTHQGSSAACVMLVEPMYIELIDIDFKKYHRFLGLIASAFCEERLINLKLRQVDSTSPESAGRDCDMLLIDTEHSWERVLAELTIHADTIQKYIVFHDTSLEPAIAAGVEEWSDANGWKIVEQGKSNVGYMVVKRLNGI